MRISVINKSKLERTLRIDSEYYQQKYIDIEKTLIKLPDIKPITELCRVSDGNHMSIAEHFINDQGVPYYRGQDITDFFLENIMPVFIPKEIYNTPVMKRSHFKVGDVLLSIVGTVGSLSLVTENIKEATGSCKIAILRPANIISEYLAVYLMSKYGNEQIKRNTRGAVQTGLILEDFSQIYVANVSKKLQNLICEIVKESLAYNNNSRNLYQQAEHILLSELSLINWKPKHRLSFIKNFSDTQTSERVDAEYFQPMYEEILYQSKDKVKTFKADEIFTFRRGDFIDTKYYTKNKTKRAYIRIKELSNVGCINSNEVIYLEDTFNNNSQNTLKENDIVMAIIGDTIGKSNLILKEFVGSYFSNNTGRFRLRPEAKDSYDPFYLETLFHSIYIQSQIERAKAQTGQPKIADKEVKNISIPCISLNKQKQISSNIKKAIENKDHSKRLLDIAKCGVEMAIEKNEKDAQNWINAEVKKLVNEGQLSLIIKNL